jgi:hypothetical protein
MVNVRWSLYPDLTFWREAMQHTRLNTGTARSDREKISRIREKISVVFGIETAMDDNELSDCYTITREGDLVMILK